MSCLIETKNSLNHIFNFYIWCAKTTFRALVCFWSEGKQAKRIQSETKIKKNARFWYNGKERGEKRAFCCCCKVGDICRHIFREMLFCSVVLKISLCTSSRLKEKSRLFTTNLSKNIKSHVVCQFPMASVGAKSWKISGQNSEI